MSLQRSIDNTSRVSSLRKKIKAKELVRILEVHNGISALIANDAAVELKNGEVKQFDGFWESSLTDSASKGFPDIEIVGIDSRLHTINEILEITDRPLIVDGDTGGDFNQFEYTVKRLERTGVSMVIIEDKVFPKRNSLEAGTRQTLENIEVFAEKLRRGVAIKTNPDFMVVARMESLIAGLGLQEALERAYKCLLVGTDGIMIHAKSTDPAPILEFAKKYYQFPKRLLKNRVLVSVPTTYNTITDTELKKHGFQVSIHANHMLRSAYKAMEEVSRKILFHDRSFEVDGDCVSVGTVFEKVGFMSVKKKDEEVADKLKSKIKAIIPAAGKPNPSQHITQAIATLNISGKTLLQRQMEALNKASIDNLVVIKGYQQDSFTLENVKYYINKAYEKTGLLHSFFIAEKEMSNSFIMAYSDILFHPNIIRSLISGANSSQADIILVVDESYQDHKHSQYKKLDLVRTNRVLSEEPVRQVNESINEEIVYIGKKVSEEMAQYEFVGIAYFSEKGATILKDVYKKLKSRSGKFHESSSFKQASFTDMIQEIVDRGYRVKVMKAYKGWMEVHNKSDIALAESFYAQK